MLLILIKIIITKIIIKIIIMSYDLKIDVGVVTMTYVFCIEIKHLKDIFFF